MKRTPAKLGALCGGLALAACASTASRPDQSQAWRENMRELSETLSYALPELHRAAPGEASVKLMKKVSGQLQGLAHSLASGAALPSPDPSSKYLGLSFADDVQQIQLALEHDRTEDARRGLLRVTRYCFSCHTQRPGPSNPNAFLLRSADEMESWTSVERGEFYASIRDFDDSQRHFHAALLDKKWARANPEKWAQAFEKVMSITLRVRRDASVGIVLIDRFALNPDYPRVLAGPAKRWKKQLEAWRDRQDRRDDKDSAADFVYRAKNYLANASASESFIQSLLAILELQQAFARTPEGEVAAEALYWHGVASDRLARLGFPDSARDYWKACRDRSGAGPWSDRCREKLG